MEIRVKGKSVSRQHFGIVEIIFALVILGGVALGTMGLLPSAVQDEASKIGAIGKQYTNQSSAMVSTFKSPTDSSDSTKIPESSNNEINATEIPISESWGLSWLRYHLTGKK